MENVKNEKNENGLVDRGDRKTIHVKELMVAYFLTFNYYSWTLQEKHVKQCLPLQQKRNKIELNK